MSDRWRARLWERCVNAGATTGATAADLELTLMNAMYSMRLDGERIRRIIELRNPPSNGLPFRVDCVHCRFTEWHTHDSGEWLCHGTRIELVEDDRYYILA